MKGRAVVKLIFLDRDGVINKYPGDGKYVTALPKFRFLPDVKKAVALLSKKKFKIFVISNQAGVSKGIYSKTTLNEITQYMLKKIQGYGGKIDAVYYCRHQERHNCLCRKPKAGLIEKALKEHSIAKKWLKRAFFIGDSTRDVLTAKAAGVKSMLVFSGKEKPANKDNWQVKPDYTAKDLFSAVKLIISGKIE